MSPRSKYRTKQRERLLEYLKGMQEKHITALDVCDHFKGQGESIGQSTVYRQLESLVEEGLVNKYIIDMNSPACFEYVGEGSHVGGGTCFHFKCEKCGKLIHLHCEELEGMQSHLYDEHKLRLDTMRTVFYGLCDSCCL